MPRYPFRLAPLFVCVAALFGTPALADEPAAVPSDASVRTAPSTDSVTPAAAPVATQSSAAPATPADTVAVPTSSAVPATAVAPAVPATPIPAATPTAVAAPTVSVPVVGSATAPAPQTLAAQPDAAASQNDLWDRVRQGFKMTETDSAAVKRLEKFYASKPQYIQRVAERSRRYLYFIVNEVEKRGMPTEIALLPIVESAFTPKAQSWASASGLWQFIPSTGARYGLERTWWYDGRQDVMAATYAALDYLQDLYNQFGDWQLALAAYNWGEGGVGRAVKKSLAKGQEGTFDSIKKPHETAGYVPALMAVRNIIAKPEAFGLTLPAMPNKPYFEPVSTGRHIDVEVAAKLADTTVEELLQLNPGLIRPVFAYKDDRKLLLPADKVETFEHNLQTYDKPLLSWQPYVTKRGESLASIADKFSIALAELREVNKLGNGRSASGQTILVPIRDDVEASDRQNLAALISGAAAGSKPSAKDDDGQPDSHRVAKGETVFSIAKQFGVTVDALKQANGLRSNKVALGRTLKIPATTVASAKAGKRAKSDGAVKTVHYVVKRGDTLDDIARRHDVTVADLKKWNKPMARGALKVGYKLTIRDEG